MENDMTRVPKAIFVEALSTSDDLIPAKDKAAYDRAEKVWGKVATTNAGEYAVIADAQNGGKLSKLFLLKLAFENGDIRKTLWKFLGPNPSFQRQRIAQGDTAIYRSIVSESLEQILRRWDLSTPNTKEDYFSNFFFQVASRVKTNTTRYNKEQNRGGMSGKVLKNEKEPQIGSYEAHTTDLSGKSNEKNEIETQRNPFKEPENLDAWQTFIDDADLDVGPTPTTREVLKYFLEHVDTSFDAKACGAAFGKTHVTIYSKLKSMKDILETHGINYEAFLSLMQTHGAKSLADTL